MPATVNGIRAVQRALESKRKKHLKGIERGLKKAGLYLQAESQRICPVEFGNLRASAGTRSEGELGTTVVYVFYTADYAIYVHEIIENFHEPPTQAKFLEQPAREKQPEMARIIREEASA